jgi:4-amino-4-deoxy-L-arabinose transferase-like glycosyltransferase
MTSAAGPGPSAGLPRLPFTIVLVIAAALRIAALDKPLYVDEISTITVATAPLASMGEVMRQIDASPALYPLLLKLWLTASHANWWARLLSAIFGWLLVPVLALLACRLFDWRAGLATAFVAAIAPAHVHYAQYVRSYSLFTFLAALHLLWFTDLLAVSGVRRDVTRTQTLAFALLTAALLYTHYLSLLLLPAEGLFAITRWRSDRRRTLAWIAAVAIGGVLFLPGVPLLLHNMAFDRVRNVDRAEPPSAVKLLPDLVAELSVGQRPLGFSEPSVRRATLAAAAVVFPLLLIAAVASGWPTRRDAIVLLLLFAWLPVAIYVGSGRRLVAVRFFLPFMTAYLVLLGCGLAAAVRAGRAWGAAAAVALTVVCAIPLWHFYARYVWSYDHRQVAAAIAAAAGSNSSASKDEVLLFVHPYEQFYYRWYLGDRLAMRGLIFTPLEEQGVYVIKPPPLDVARAQARVQITASRYPRVWIVGQSKKSFASDADAERHLLTWMDATYTRGADLSALTGGDPVVRQYLAR